MKNRNLNMLIRASVKTRKFTVRLFSCFVLLSVVLILVTVEILVPLGKNIDEKINHHLSRREICVDYPYDYPPEGIEEGLERIENTEFVKDVYRIPAGMSLFEQSGVLFSSYRLEFLHKECTPKIIAGRCFREDETDVILVPSKFKDYNEAEREINEINGADLVGKTLECVDDAEFVHRLKVVGAYDNSDPIFGADAFVTSRTTLLKYNEAMFEKMQKIDENFMKSYDLTYMILTEAPENTEGVFKQLNEFASVYIMPVNLDADTYNIAFAVLVASAGFFIAFAVFGLYMFLKNNINSRTKELALYRATGFNSKNMYYIIFAEHFMLGAISIAVGLIATFLLIGNVVNPYLLEIAGGTFMEMTASVSPVESIAVIVGYLLIMSLVCVSAVKRSEKIDLTVLLKE